MKKGTVVSYKNGHGRRFGFIQPKNGSERVFFHYSAVGDACDIPVGTQVTFAAVRGPKGLQATLVTYKKDVS